MKPHSSYITFESEEGFKALVEYATVGIILVDQRGKIVFANPQAAELFGYTRSELINSPIEKLIPENLREGHEETRRAYHKNPRPRQMGSGLDLWALRKDGSSFPVEISLSNYASGENQWVIAFINDISTRKKAEEMEKKYALELEREVKERTAALSKSNNRLTQLNKTKSRFVSLASHEFRTPLSTILTSLSLIGHYSEPHQIEKRNKHISRIKSSVRMMTNILEDFLSLDKLNQGVVSSEPELFDIGKLLFEIRDELEAMKKTGQTVCIQVSNAQEVRLNKKLVMNILVNLTSNAIKYTPEKKRIELSCCVEPSSVVLKVADEGIGIPQKDQENLFEMFYRASNVGSIRGTGLGLNIVHKYVELLNGKVEFTSVEGKGTTFIITLPQILHTE